MAKRVLLTGASGFLGSNLARRLVSNGVGVVALCRPTSNLERLGEALACIEIVRTSPAEWEQLFQGRTFDCIIHCATNYGRRVVSPTEVIEANLSMPLHLLQLGARYGVPAFINSDTILNKRVSHYSLSKKQFLDWLELFANSILCVNVALEHFYGPFDDPTKFVPEMVGKFLKHEPVIDLTPGEQKRDFVYIDDVVDAFIAILENHAGRSCGFQNYEVGSGRTLTIRSFVEKLQGLTGNTDTQLRFGALPYREHEVMETQIDLSQLRALGWGPRVSLDDGLSQTIASERRRV